MKSITKNIKTFLLALLTALVLCGIAMPVAIANAEPVSESATNQTRTSMVTSLSGDLQPGQANSKTFSISSTAAVKVVYTSFSQVGEQYAPVRVYIDGVAVATSNGYNSGITIWYLTKGAHTLKVENTGSVWLAFAVDIVTI